MHACAHDIMSSCIMSYHFIFLGCCHCLDPLERLQKYQAHGEELQGSCAWTRKIIELNGQEMTPDDPCRPYLKISRDSRVQKIHVGKTIS